MGLGRWPSITEWEMHITAQGPRLRNDLYCVEWDSTIPYLIKFRAERLTESRAMMCHSGPNDQHLVESTFVLSFIEFFNLNYQKVVLCVTLWT